MALKIFVFFPQVDDIIIQIVDSEAAFKAFMFQFSESIRLIRERNHTQILYDKDNLAVFLEKCKSWYWPDGAYLDNVPGQIRILLGQNSLEITDNNASLVVSTNVYLIWNLDNFYACKMVEIAPHLVCEVAERLFHFPEESVLLLNFNNAIPTDRPAVLVFKDEVNLQNPHPQDPPLPNSFAHIPTAISKQELLDWLDNFATQIGMLKVAPNQIQALIKKGQTESVFKRLDSPKILGEQLHMHFKDDEESALNIDGSWKHGNYNIPTAAKDQLREWGFIVP